MKIFVRLITLSLLVFSSVQLFNAQNANGCTNGKFNGIFYTTCYDWKVADGKLSDGITNDDTKRLQRAIDGGAGKVIFNESNYYITDSINILNSYRILEGTGKSSLASQESSKIFQMTNDKSIFKIAGGIYEVSIRDMSLVAGSGKTGVIGILAQDSSNASHHFQFTSLRFSNLNKGIYVNAQDTNKGWQFDNVRLDHSTFENCKYGVHVNSFNSGWNITSIDFAGTPKDGYGIYMERVTYTSIDGLIGNGQLATLPSADLAESLIYVKGHSVLSIRNSVAEGYRNDIIVDGNGVANEGVSLNMPINLINNHFLNGVSIKDSTVVSTANQFGYNAIVPAVAKGISQIYSIGDKFCFEGVSNCENVNWTLEDDANIVFSTNKYKNTTSVPTLNSNTVEIARDNYDNKPSLSLLSPNYAGNSLFRLGRGSYYYDITRSESDGRLRFFGNQSGFTGYKFDVNGAGFTINGGNLGFENGGTITIGNKTYSNLGAETNGTLVYCSDCNQASPCSSGGTGAFAKRINGGWICN